MRQLDTVREINAATWANIGGKNNGVYCQVPGEVGFLYRVQRARTVQGVLQVRLVDTGMWVVPVAVYVV
jgi:hypothetical protein